MFTRRALLAFGFLASGALAESTCPATIRLLFKATPEAPNPGKSLKVTYTLSNKSGLDVRSSTMGIHLPDHVTYTSSNSKPMGSRGALVDDTATWANGGAIKAGKSKTYTANMQVGAGAQMLAFDATAQLTLSDGSSCNVVAPQSLVRAKGFKHAVQGGGSPMGGSYRMAARLDADSSPTGYVEFVHFQAEGYEIVSACWTGAGNANKPPALTAAIGNRTADFQHSVFMRKIAGAVPLVAPMQWWGECEGNDNLEQVPRQFSSSNLPFEDVYCVADCESGSTGSYGDDYFDGEIYVGNDLGGMFSIEGEDSNWLVENARPNDQNVCYVLGTINYFPSDTNVVVD